LNLVAATADCVEKLTHQRAIGSVNPIVRLRRSAAGLGSPSGP
jgi:hypothetical protein